MSGFSFTPSAASAPSANPSAPTAAAPLGAATAAPAPAPTPAAPAAPFAAPSAASTAPQQPPQQQPPPQDQLGKVIQDAISTGRLSNAGSAEIRSKLVSPFTSPSAAAVGAQNPLGALNSGNTFGSTPFSAATTRNVVGGATAPGLFSSVATTSQNAASLQNQTGPGIYSSSTGQQTNGVESLRSVSVSKAGYLLDLLLLCESGSKIEGLLPAVGSISTATCNNIVDYISNSISAAMAPKDSVGLGLGIGVPSSTSAGGNAAQRNSENALAVLSENGRYNSVLLASQCLFLLTRHFQVNDDCLKKICSVLELLYAEVSATAPVGNAENMKARRGIRTRRPGGGPYSGNGSTSYGIVDRRVASVAGSSNTFACSSLFEMFRRGASTASLSAVTWLTTMSLVNALCLWRDIHDANGKLAQNALLSIASVSTFLDSWVATQKKRLAPPDVPKTDGYGNQIGGGGGGGSRFDVADFRSNRAMYGAADSDRNKARLHAGGSTIALGYVSIVTLCLAMFNSGKSEEINMDGALNAFFGQRPTQGSVIPADKGKVAKRMMQLAPVAGSLIIPMECVYIVPYEMFSAIFDEMLPVVKCVADEDLATYATFSEESVEMEDRIARAQTTGRMQPSAGDQIPIAGQGLSTGMQGYDDRTQGMRDYSPHAAFSSEMAHILQLLTTCLEHLPPEVLNPDYDMDCSATFFIFKNCVVHLRAVFASQRPQSTWEPYTFKLVAHLLHVLAMIGRNPQYMPRVVSLLSTAQDECAELQWPSLLAQAYECAGLNQGRGDLLFGGMYGGGGVGSATNGLIDDGNRRAPLASLYSSPAVGLQMEEEPYLDAVDFSHQHSKEYAMEKQQEYVASLFMLLRLVAAHSALFAEIREHITLDVALAFLFAPKLSQEMLGSSLALIGACIHSSADAEKVWRVLEDNQLLQYMEIPSHVTPSSFTEEAFGRFFRSTGNNANGNLVTKNGDVVESLSLVGHCLYESHSAHYPITIGFLHLMIAIFRYHAPMVHYVPSYSTVVRFIAEDVMRGVLRRHFQTADERYTVAALAAAALSKAFGVRFVSPVHIGSSGTTSSSNSNSSSGAAGSTGLMTPLSALPFGLVIAASKAPTDVLGEVLTIVDEAARSPNDLLNYKRAATYQCLQLIFEAIRAKKEQNIDNSFTFDARTINSSSFAALLLPLAAANDSLMAASALSLLYAIPADTVSGAAKSWFARPDVSDRIINPFASLLLPDTRSTSVVLAPPELSLLLERENYDVHTPEFAVRTKSLLLDILVHHSTSPQSSLASWLFGYPMHGIAPTSRPSLCFDSVVSGATSESIDAQHPDLAVKYVRILYQMRVNKTLNTTGLRDALSMRRCQKLFTAALKLDPSSCSPAMLCKSGYVLKLLALEVFQLGIDEELNGNAADPNAAGSLVPASSASTGKYARYALPQSRRQSISLRLVQLLIKLREHSRARNAGTSFTDAHSSSSNNNNSSMYASPFDDQVEEHTLLSMFQDAHGCRGVNDEGNSGRQLIDFSRWILLCLESLTAFPSIHAPGGAELYVRRTLEDAPQYSIPMLHEGFLQERLESGKPPLSMHDMRNLLLPFVDANACLVSYASAVQFVKGWCDLLETAVTLMPEASVNRLLTYVENISESVMKTSSLTLAAQEQIVCRLARCQRTLVARVHMCLRQAAEVLLQGGGDGRDGGTQWKSTNVTPYWRSNGAEKRYRAGESAALSGKRRTRSASVQSRVGAGASREYIYGRSYTPAYASRSSVGNTSSVYPDSMSVGRSDSMYNGAVEGSVVLRDGTKVPTVPFEESVLDQWLVEENCDRSRLSQILTALIMNLLTLGPQVPAVRAELYESLLLLVSTPGVRIDELVLWRYYNELFSLIVDDIVRPITSQTQSAALSFLRKLIISSAQMRNLFCVASGGAGGSTEVTAALAQSPATLGSSRAGSGGAASAHLLTFISNTLYCIDSAAVTLFMGNSSPSAVTTFLEHVESVFDILSMLSIEYPWQVHRAQALSTCVGMKMWTLSARVALGHVAPNVESNAATYTDHAAQQQQQHQRHGETYAGQSTGPQRLYPYNNGSTSRTDSTSFDARLGNTSTAPSAALSAETTDTSKEILKRMLMYAVRWYNTLLSQLQHSEEVGNLLKSFLEQNDMLFKTVLSSPHSIARRGVVGQTTLTLLSEITGFLLTLSNNTASTAAACRSLISGLTLPELLSVLVSRKFRDEVNRNVALPHGSGSNGAGLAVGGGKRSDSDFGNARSVMHLQHLIGTVVRNLTLFLARTESMDTLHNGVVQLQSGPSLSPQKSAVTVANSLRSNPQYVEVLIRATAEVTEAIDSWLSQYFSEWKSGCSSYLLSLHALVFLLHSFLLSVNANPSTTRKTTARGSDESALKETVANALVDAQDMLHEWFAPRIYENGQAPLEPPQHLQQHQRPLQEVGRQPLLLSRSNAAGQLGEDASARGGLRGRTTHIGVSSNNAQGGTFSTPSPRGGGNPARINSAALAPVDLPPTNRSAGYPEYARGGERSAHNLIARVDAELNEVENDEMGWNHTASQGRMTDPLDRNEVTQEGFGNGSGGGSWGALETIGTLTAKNNNGELTWKNNAQRNGDGYDTLPFPEYPESMSFLDYVFGGVNADIEPLVKQVQVALSNAIRAASV